MNIKMQFIPTAQMRYASWGDWRYDDSGDLIIDVVNDNPELPTFYHQFLIARHELDEAIMCMRAGITQKQVDDFDFDKSEYANENDLELGDMKDCPYKRQHRAATIFEHLMEHELMNYGYGEVK